MIYYNESDSIAEIIKKIKDPEFDGEIVIYGFVTRKTSAVNNFLNEIRLAPGAIEKITKINFQNTSFTNDSDVPLDFSEFSSLTDLDLCITSIDKPPILRNCIHLKSILLSGNKLTELPDISDCKHLILMRITHNYPGLSQAAIEQAKSIMAKNRKRGGLILQITNPYAPESKLSQAVLENKSLTELVNTFVTSVDAANIDDVRAVATEFNTRFSGSDANVKDQLKDCINLVTLNPLFHSKFILLEKFCQQLDRKNYHGRNENYMNFLEAFETMHFNTNLPRWLPDFSFLSDLETVQLPIGKIRASSHESPYTQGMLIPMRFSYWQTDKMLRYLSAEEKKQLKLRKTKTPFVLKRNIDNSNRLATGNYIYALSLNGGLIVSDGKEFPNIGQHSTLRAGQYLICAGHINVDPLGKISMISNESGHTCPPVRNLICAAIRLHLDGYLSEDCEVENQNHEKLGTIKEVIAKRSEIIQDSQVLEFINDMLKNNNTKKISKLSSSVVAPKEPTKSSSKPPRPPMITSNQPPEKGMVVQEDVSTKERIRAIKDQEAERRSTENASKKIGPKKH